MRVQEFPRRAARHVAWRAERATTLTLARFRRGDRTIIMTPPAGLRFGNWLYLWLDAHARTAAGHPTFVRQAPGMQTWLDAIPALRPLTLSPAQLRFHDRREWDERSWHQRFGVDFTPEQLDAFVRAVLAPAIAPDPTDALVVNIRRGDYYSDAGHRRTYGFDQIGYVTQALARVGPVPRTLVVSDDPDWCRIHLDGVLRASSAEVAYAPQDPVGNFVAVGATRRLIGSNSTFSYWGGYIARARHEDAVVIMPRFHGRLPGGSDAYQLDPRWTIIDGYDDPVGDDAP